MASSVEAGRAFVRVDSDLNPLEKSLAKIDGIFKGLGSKFSSIGSTVSNVGSGIAKVGAGVTAIGAGVLAPIAAATAKFAQFGGEIDDVAQRTGMTGKAVSELGYAATLSGTDLATVEGAALKMQKGIVAAANGSRSMSDAFGAIGLSAKQLASLSPEEQFSTIAKAIGSINDPAQKTSAAMAIFGKSGSKLTPMLAG
jgi:hypothetical protein